jgi:acyl carrier protein
MLNQCSFLKTSQKQSKEEAVKESLTFEVIRNIISELANIEIVILKPETSLRMELELKDLEILELAHFLERNFQIKIPQEEEYNFETIRDIAQYIDRLLQQKALSSVQNAIVEVLNDKGISKKRKNISPELELNSFHLNGLETEGLVLQLEGDLNIMLLDEETQKVRTVTDYVNLIAPKLIPKSINTGI